MTASLKSELRKKIKAERNAIPANKRYADSLIIKEKLFSLPEFKKASNVLFYISFRSEVNTHDMIRETLKLGLNVYVPVTKLREKCLEIVKLNDFDKELAISTYGILEPARACTDLINKNILDAIIMPGLIFDRSFNRIGYGGGFYDRLLCDISPKTRKIALCFEAQLVESVPTEEKDIKPDIILTEKDTYRRK